MSDFQIVVRDGCSAFDAQVQVWEVSVSKWMAQSVKLADGKLLK